jgi:hypothetical protein
MVKSEELIGTTECGKILLIQLTQNQTGAKLLNTLHYQKVPILT